MRNGRPSENVDGLRFGRLVILYRYESSGSKNPLVMCKCDCGIEKVCSLRSIKKGSTTSCGCYSREVHARPQSRLPDGVAVMNNIIHTYKDNARVKGLSFSLTALECELLFQGDCHYCGCKPSRTVSKKGIRSTYTYNGIDRMINSLGYDAGNVVSCCTECNFKKRDQDYEEFVSWIYKVHSHLAG